MALELYAEIIKTVVERGQNGLYDFPLGGQVVPTLMAFGGHDLNPRPAGAPGFPRPAGGGVFEHSPSNSAPGPRSDTG